MKYCQTKNEYIDVTPSSSDQPEALGVCIYGKRSDEKDSSYIVNATLKLKQPSMAKGFLVIGKIDLNTTNDYHEGWDVNAITTIDVINYIFL